MVGRRAGTGAGVSVVRECVRVGVRVGCERTCVVGMGARVRDASRAIGRRKYGHAHDLKTFLLRGRGREKREGAVGYTYRCVVASGPFDLAGGGRGAMQLLVCADGRREK